MDAIGQVESCRRPLTDPPIRLALTVTYHPREPTDRSLVLRFDDVAIATFAPSFHSERFDLHVTPEPRDRGWVRERPGFPVEDEHGDWISFRCADFTVEEVRRS
jgi:hypothetical protein